MNLIQHNAWIFTCLETMESTMLVTNTCALRLHVGLKVLPFFSLWCKYLYTIGNQNWWCLVTCLKEHKVVCKHSASSPPWQITNYKHARSLSIRSLGVESAHSTYQLPQHRKCSLNVYHQVADHSRTHSQMSLVSYRYKHTMYTETWWSISTTDRGRNWPCSYSCSSNTWSSVVILYQWHIYRGAQGARAPPPSFPSNWLNS